MFPWVCLATMPLFYPFHWPKTFILFLKVQCHNIKKTISNIVSSCKYSIVQNCQNNDVRNEGATMSKDKNNVQEELHTRDTSNDDITNDNHTDHNGKDSISTEEKVDEQVNKDQKKTKPIQEESVTKIEMDNKNHRKKVTTWVIVIYVLMQAFLPCSHFITKVCNLE